MTQSFGVTSFSSSGAQVTERAIPTHGNTASVQLTVYHRNALGLDEFLGQIQLPLNEYDVYERPKNRWHRLKGKPEKDKKKGEKERGELEAKIAFTVKSGSLSDISKKEKDKLKTSLTSLKHLGGSLMSLGTKEKQGLKKFAKSVSHKIDKVAKKPRFKGRKSSQDSQGFPQEHLPSRQHYGDADPGVISDSDDEKFGFDEEVQVATGSSSPYSTVSRGSSYIHEEEPEQGNNGFDLKSGDFFRRNNSLPIGPSSKPPPKPARLGSDLFGKGAVSEVTPVNSESHLPPLPPSPRSPPSRSPRVLPRSPLASPPLPTVPSEPEPDNLSSSPNTLTFSNLTPIDLTPTSGRARESVPPSFPPPPVPEDDASPPVSFVTLESHTPKEPQDQKLPVKDESVTLSPSPGFSSNSGSSGFFGEDSISQPLNQSDPKIDEISLSSSVSSRPEPDLSFEKDFIEIPTKQEREFIEIPTKLENEFIEIPTKEEKETIEIPTKEEKEFIEIPTKQEENFIELATKQDHNSAISALEEKNKTPEKSSDEGPIPAPRKEKPPNLSLKCNLTPTSSLSTFDSFHSIQSSSSNSHLGSALAAASISYLTPLVPSSPAVVPPPSPSIMPPPSNIFGPTSPAPPPVPADPPPTTSSPTVTSSSPVSSSSQTLSPSTVSPASNTVPVTSAPLTSSVPPTPVVATSITTTSPITPSLPPTPVTTSTPAPSIGSKPSTAVVRSGSLHEKRSSEPSIDEWERKLYGRNACE
ncbi:uncharacterized protein LOC143017835 [Oratosquilla oratoria]|uniref:uncharacterized protein LOC143017835 n=1 Tax=Oratosquilla oratoria TaxID=337810 RepID=UPI003F76EAA3